MQANEGSLGILGRSGLRQPDGRPLFAYAYDVEQRRQLAELLRRVRSFSGASRDCCACFVLWASEEIRAHLEPGGLTWDWLFARLGRSEQQAIGRDLVERGLHWWGRKVRRSDGGDRLFLYSLMAEGGLPDSYLAQAPRYRGAVLAMLEDIERAGSVDGAAEDAADRHVSSLPQTFQNIDTARLLAELALEIARIRKRFPVDTPAGKTVTILDSLDPSWRERLPLRLSEDALDALILPALRAPKVEAEKPPEPLVRRELRLRANGVWDGYAVVGEGAFLARPFLPDADPELRLRLLALGDGGAPPSFQALPEVSGWRLKRVGSASAAALALPLRRPVVFEAYVDGRPVGKAIVDSGLPPLSLPTLWRATDPNEDEPTRLTLLAGAARTRLPHLFLLTGKLGEVSGDETVAAGRQPTTTAGLEIGAPMQACNGLLWPLSGNGEVSAAGRTIRIETGADTDAPSYILHTIARHLAGWRAVDGRIPFLGTPEFWGGIEGTALRRLDERVVRRRQVMGRLGDVVAEWRNGDDVLSRTSFIELPAELRLSFREIRPGTARLEMSGLVPGWTLRLAAGEAAAGTRVGNTGQATLEVMAVGELPSTVTLAIGNPATSVHLKLITAWPARYGMLIGHDQKRLKQNRGLAIGALGTWRAFAPTGVGSRLQLRYGTPPLRVSFPASDETNLAAMEPLARLMLGLAGPDDAVNLRLIVDGDEGHRLELRRYDPNSGAGFMNGAFLAAGSTWVLHATPLTKDPDGLLRLEGVCGGVSLSDWLGSDGGPWLVQASAEDGRVMRPAVWPSEKVARSTREARILAYAEEWGRKIAVSDQAWWRARWRRITSAREGGDAGALDEVQALGLVPEAAVSLLFRRNSDELAAAVSLEGAAPLWWPATPISAWKLAVQSHRAGLSERLAAVGEEAAEADKAICRRAHDIMLLRPELRGHLFAACLSNGVPCDAVPIDDSTPRSLINQDPRAGLETLAQAAAKRDTHIPEGVTSLPKSCFGIAARFSDHLRPLVDAPLLTAEIAAGQRIPDRRLLLLLIALRQADPFWFDQALPCAIQMLLEKPA